MNRKLRLIGLLMAVGLASSLAQAEEEIEFNTAMNSIVKRSTGIDFEESTLGSIHSKNIPSRLYFLPNLSLSARNPLGGATNVFPLQQQIQLSSQWNLFRWGADYIGAQASGYEESSQKAVVDATVLKVEEDAVVALLGEIQRKKEVEINNEIVKNQSEMSTIAQARYREGYLPLQEAEKTTVDLANTRASLIDAQIKETDARANLEALLGHANIISEWPWIQQLKNSERLPLLKQDQDLSNRPDWNAAQNRVEYLNSKTSQNWRLLLPSLDTEFSYGYYSGFFGSATGWVGYLTVNFPLFDHLSNYSNARQQSYLRTASEARLEQVQRNARAEWAASRSNFKMALESALAREETLVLSRKLFRDNQRRFQAGRITSNDLSVDRSRMYQAELNAVQGWSVAHLSLTKLCHSLGYRVERCLSKE